MSDDEITEQSLMNKLPDDIALLKEQILEMDQMLALLSINRYQAEVRFQHCMICDGWMTHKDDCPIPKHRAFSIHYATTDYERILGGYYP